MKVLLVLAVLVALGTMVAGWDEWLLPMLAFGNFQQQQQQQRQQYWRDTVYPYPVGPSAGWQRPSYRAPATSDDV